MFFTSTVPLNNQIGPAATIGTAVLPLSLLPVLSSMLELPFHLFDCLIGGLCVLLEIIKGVLLCYY